jgi:diacylglycerol kinase
VILPVKESPIGLWLTGIRFHEVQKRIPVRRRTGILSQKPGHRNGRASVYNGGQKRATPGITSLKRPNLWQSFGHAWNGLAFTVRTQRNARIHLVFAVVVTVLAVWLRLDVIHCAILAVMIGGVLVGELLNTALEALVDLISPDYHDAAKIAKDVSAGAVLILGLTSIIVGLLILGPALWLRIVSIFYPQIEF